MPPNAPTTLPQAALAHLLATAGRPLRPEDAVAVTGSEPVLPTRFLLTTAAAAALAAVGVAAADLWRLRTGRQQRVSLDLRTAAVAARGDRYLSIDGKPSPREWEPIMGFYPTKDGRWFMVHANFPHHREGALRLLGCDHDRTAVARAVAGWDAPDLEEAFAAAGLVGGMLRSRSEWEAHPQGRTVTQLPTFEVLKIGDAPPQPLPAGPRPLSGVRVLELTRVIAGPVGGRTLAEHGAEVLHLRAPHLPGSGVLDVDTNHGKRSAFLDLNDPDQEQRARALLQEADVFSQSYRPGALAGRGFAPEAVAEVRPGIVCITLSAHGHAGPWATRRGFDTLLQTTTGFVEEERAGGEPRHLPAQTMDYVSGYLMAFGAMVALARRATEGGSYLVRVSLAQTGHWIDSLGRVPSSVALPAAPALADVADLLMDTASPWGRLRHVAPVPALSETPPRYDLPSVPFGTHPAAWAEAR